MLRNPDEMISKLRAARVCYVEAVVRWRTARDEAEKNLKAAEHTLAKSLARLERDSG